MAYLGRAARRGGSGGGRRAGARPSRRAGWLAAGLALLAAACAGTPPPASSPAPSGRFELARDAFAFPNLVRAERPGWNDDFANYCILMTRAASQFFRFARFAPERPPVSEAEYARLVRAVLARDPWDPPAPAAGRVVVPGYADLHAFSRAHEGLLKAALGSNVLSMLHWRTWRAGIDLPPAHQERLARELGREVEAGRPAPLMITNFPHEDLLNHAVLVYGRRPSAGGVEFLAYDPNDPGSPLGLHWDPATRSFWIAPLTYSPPGRVRAFRLYTSSLF